jgi:hypothetical protein
MLEREPAPAGPEHGTADEITATGYVAFHNGAVEHRFIPLPNAANGAVLDWIRLIVPVLADRPLTSLQRIAHGPLEPIAAARRAAVTQSTPTYHDTVDGTLLS